MSLKTIGVWLRLKGRNFNPDVVCESVDLMPTKKYYYKKPKKKDSKYLARTGLWQIEMPAEMSLDEQLGNLIAMLTECDFKVLKSWSLDEAYIDIFIAEYNEEHQRVESSIHLLPNQMSAISQMGLSLNFTS